MMFKVKYAHLTFETSDLRTYTGSKGDELIDLYDKIVYSEQQLLGLEKYDKMFRNRMYLNVKIGRASCRERV